MTSHEASVVAFLEQFADSWQKNDGTVLGDTFTGAGTLINPFGERADGRSAVAAMYAAGSLSVPWCRPSTSSR